MSQDQPFIWKSSLEGSVSWVGWSLWVSPGWGKQCQPGWWSLRYGNWLLALCICGHRKQTISSAHLSVWEKAVPHSHLDARHFTFFLYSMVPFKLLPQCWSSEGVSLIKSICGFFQRTCLGLQKFLPLTQSLLVFVARSYGGLSSGTGTLVQAACCGTGTPCS